MAEQTVYLIEAPGPFYMAAREIGGQFDFTWTETAFRGIRFSDAAQADSVMMAIKALCPKLFPRCFPRDPKPTEHRFCDLREEEAPTP